MKYLTWVNGLRGPTPQVWGEKDLMQEGKPVPKLAQHELTEPQSEFSLASLMALYPYEAKS